MFSATCDWFCTDGSQITVFFLQTSAFQCCQWLITGLKSHKQQVEKPSIVQLGGSVLECPGLNPFAAVSKLGHFHSLHNAPVLSAVWMITWL